MPGKTRKFCKQVFHSRLVPHSRTSAIRSRTHPGTLKDADKLVCVEIKINLTEERQASCREDRRNFGYIPSTKLIIVSRCFTETHIVTTEQATVAGKLPFSWRILGSCGGTVHPADEDIGKNTVVLKYVKSMFSDTCV